MKIHAHGTGTTVFELMVTLSIAAILLAAAIPSFESFINRQRMKSAVSSLHSDLSAARSQAVYRNAVVVACPGDPATGCLDGSEWTGGWIIFEDDNGDRQLQKSEHLMRHGQPQESVMIHGPPNRPDVRFFPDGSTPGSNASIGLCGRGGPQHARRLVISNIGRIRRDTFPGVDPALCPT